MTQKCSFPLVFGYEVGSGINGNANASREKAGNNHIRARQIGSNMLKLAGYVPLLGAVVGVGRIADMVFIHKTGEYRLPLHLMAARFVRSTLEIAGIGAVFLPLDAACTIFRVIFTDRFDMVAAIESDDSDFVKWALKDRKLDPNIARPDGRLPLHIAVRRAATSRNLDVLTALLENPRVNPNIADGLGWTALRLAFESGDPRLVTAVLANPETDPNTAFWVGGESPLYLAARLGSPDLLRAILQNPRFDPNIGSVRSVLCDVVRRGEEDMLRVLLENPRVDPNAKDGGGDSPLHRAVAAGNDDIVKTLLENDRVLPNIVSDNGYSPVNYAVLDEKAGLIKLFLDRGQRVRPDIIQNKITGLSQCMKSNLYRPLSEDSAESRLSGFLRGFFDFCLLESTENVMEEDNLGGFRNALEELSVEMESLMADAPDDDSRNNAKVRLDSINALCLILQPRCVKSARKD